MQETIWLVVLFALFLFGAIQSKGLSRFALSLLAIGFFALSIAGMDLLRDISVVEPDSFEAGYYETACQTGDEILLVYTSWHSKDQKRTMLVPAANFEAVGGLEVPKCTQSAIIVVTEQKADSRIVTLVAIPHEKNTNEEVLD